MNLEIWTGLKMFILKRQIMITVILTPRIRVSNCLDLHKMKNRTRLRLKIQGFFL